MPVREILKTVIFCHRIADDKDFTEKIICIPASRSEYLESELRKRANAGEINTVQMGRVYIEATVRTPYEDECDKFLARLDSVRLHSSTDRATLSESVGGSPTLPEASNDVK